VNFYWIWETVTDFSECASLCLSSWLGVIQNLRTAEENILCSVFYEVCGLNRVNCLAECLKLSEVSSQAEATRVSGRRPPHHHHHAVPPEVTPPTDSVVPPLKMRGGEGNCTATQLHLPPLPMSFQFYFQPLYLMRGRPLTFLLSSS